MNRFEERVVLVTGGARGIGKGIVQAFAREGASVVFTYRHSRTEAEKLLAALKEHGWTAEAIQNDAVNTEQSGKIIEQIIDKYGKLDFLINNAGITKDQLIMRMSESDWDEVIANNLKSVYNFSKGVIRPMIKERYGRIVNISSIVGMVGNAGQSNYAASKAGIIGFTKSLAKEVASRNITINAVAPGYIQTDMTEKLNEDQKKVLTEIIPLKRLGEIADVAGVVCFLCSKDADYITGQVLCVDGGMVM